MSIISVSVTEAALMIKAGANLVDIREIDEHKRTHIPGAHHFALSQLESKQPHLRGPIIFHCKGGNRTNVNAPRLLAASKASQIYLLDGGIEAWQAAGLPIATDRKQPIEIMRQVQIGAGTMVIAGVVMGAMLHPAFYGVSAFAGIGLAFAGVTGFCGMGRLLKHAPWNRNQQALGR